jgi:uncharacterized membrane protein (UPF0127 family)
MKKGIKGKRERAKNRKNSNRYIILAVTAVIILIAFMLVMVIQPGGKTDEDEVITKVKAPEFRQDGTLQFISSTDQDTVEIAIEVVDSKEEINRGLMYRPHMPEMAGMLFIFPREEVRSFWMKNTYISLDILFINDVQEIVTIQPNTQPLSTQSVPSYKPARYVVEVNAGFTSKYQIKEGDRIEFDF